MFPSRTQLYGAFVLASVWGCATATYEATNEDEGSGGGNSPGGSSSGGVPAGGQSGVGGSLPIAGKGGSSAAGAPAAGGAAGSAGTNTGGKGGSSGSGGKGGSSGSGGKGGSSGSGGKGGSSAGSSGSGNVTMCVIDDDCVSGLDCFCCPGGSPCTCTDDCDEPGDCPGEMCTPGATEDFCAPAGFCG